MINLTMGPTSKSENWPITGSFEFTNRTLLFLMKIVKDFDPTDKWKKITLNLFVFFFFFPGWVHH